MEYLTLFQNSAIAGFLVSIVTPIIKSRINENNTQGRRLAFLSLSFLVTLIVLYTNGLLDSQSFSLEKLLVSLVTIIGSANLTYNEITKPTNIDKKIENTTTETVDRITGFLK